MTSDPRRQPILSSAVAIVLALGIIACEGDAGTEGPPGPTGQMGDPGVLDPGLPAIDKALIGLGGRDAVTAVKSFSHTATGARFITGESFQPDDEAIRTNTFTTDVAVDLENDAWRLDHQTDRIFFFTGIELTFSEIINGQLGAIAGVDSLFGAAAENRAANSARTEAVRRQAELLNPIRLLQRILADESIATETGVALVAGDVHQILEVADDIAPLSLLVNTGTGAITRLRTVESDFAEGDVAIEVAFADWRTAGDSGVLFPESVTLSVDGQPYHVESRKDIAVNPTLAADLFDFPAGLDPAPAFDETLAKRGASHHHNINAFALWGLPLLENSQNAVIQATEVGDGSGVFHLIGGAAGSAIPTGSHHTMVVDQGSSVVVIEPALHDEWGSAVVDWIAANVQDGGGNPKPISHVILTHHHHDHMGGVRRFAAAGATVVIGKAGERFIKQVLAAPFTVFPDTLAQATEAVTTEVVNVGSEPLVLGTGDLSVAAIPVDTAHAADLLVVRIDLPGTDDAVYFNSDMFNPGAPVDMESNPVPIPANRIPASTEMRTGLEAAPGGLAIQNTDLLLGGHGIATYDDPRVPGEDASFVTFADFVAQLGASSAALD